ncbi:hypothetical protein Tamer19_58610 [Cupriavidus sp. TA19]|nr:hypothetical protein Tamer19_58610 [Cupriavidus sp. TA19]
MHNMSLLFERTFESVQDLNRYRKELGRTQRDAHSGAFSCPPVASAHVET